MNQWGGAAGSHHWCKVIILEGDETIVGGSAEIIQLKSPKSAGGAASGALGEQSPGIFVNKSRMIWVTLLERCRGC